MTWLYYKLWKRQKLKIQEEEGLTDGTRPHSSSEIFRNPSAQKSNLKRFALDQRNGISTERGGMGISTHSVRHWFRLLSVPLGLLNTAGLQWGCFPSWMKLLNSAESNSKKTPILCLRFPNALVWGTQFGSFAMSDIRQWPQCQNTMALAMRPLLSPRRVRTLPYPMPGERAPTVIFSKICLYLQEKYLAFCFLRSLLNTRLTSPALALWKKRKDHRPRWC